MEQQALALHYKITKNEHNAVGGGRNGNQRYWCPFSIKMDSYGSWRDGLCPNASMEACAVASFPKFGSQEAFDKHYKACTYHRHTSRHIPEAEKKKRKKSDSGDQEEDNEEISQ